MIELKDFVAETLNQIIDGVVAAQEHAKEKGAVVNPQNYNHSHNSEIISNYGVTGLLSEVNFDIAITEIKETGTGGGVGVFVGPVAMGTRGQSGNTNSTISRIAFSVPVTFPAMEEKMDQPASWFKKEEK